MLLSGNHTVVLILFFMFCVVNHIRQNQVYSCWDMSMTSSTQEKQEILLDQVNIMWDRIWFPLSMQRDALYMLFSRRRSRKGNTKHGIILTSRKKILEKTKMGYQPIIIDALFHHIV